MPGEHEFTDWDAAGRFAEMFAQRLNRA